MTRWLLAVVLAGCGSRAPATTHAGSAEPVAPTCDSVKPKVEELYRHETAPQHPELVADNTRMVMNDCVKDPVTFAPCIARAGSVAELEKQCLVPLDDEGTEGDKR